MQNELDTLIHQSLTAIQANQMPEALALLQKAVCFTPRDPSLHNNLANVYKKMGAFNDAEKHYKEAIRLNPNYAEAHHNLANCYAQKNLFSEALSHYTQALHIAPDYALAHYHLGLLFIAYQKKEAAQIQFNNVLELNPEFTEAHFYLGLLALDHEQYAEAKLYFEKSITLGMSHPSVYVNLGVVALKEKEGQKAIDYFTKALLCDENHIEARHNLAATFMHHDRFENALAHYAVLLEHDPFHEEYLYNAGVAEMALGQLKKAEIHFKNLLKKTSQHFGALMNLSAIYTRLNQFEEAKNLLECAHQVNPTDSACQHMLNALRGQQMAETHPEYAQNLFNNYALYYDYHLQQTLQYHLPQRIGQLIHKLLSGSYHAANTLDLGCGTGLSGACLREISQHLTGIDLSEKMLDEARKKNIYDTLIVSELVDFLRKTHEHYDLVISADVLPYLGNLEPLFEALSLRLTARALFIFNIEISEIEPFSLQKSARFSHHPHYIQHLAEKYRFDIVEESTIISRQQAEKDHPVLLFALRKGASN
jgi:predicted TPR repeat methyltransferase